MRRFRWVLVAGTTGFLLSVVYMYIAFRPEAASTTAVTGGTNGAYAQLSNGSGSLYTTPVGNLTINNTPTETSLVYGPIAALAGPLKLTPEHRTRIDLAQVEAQQKIRQEERTSAQARQALFRQIQQAGLLNYSMISSRNPFIQQVNGIIHQVITPWRQSRMRATFAAMVKSHRESAKKVQEIDKGCVRDVEAILNEPQRAALPGMLAQMRDFRTLTLSPPEQYVALNLSETQKSHIAALALQVREQQEQSRKALFDTFRQQMRPPVRIPGAPSQNSALFRQRSLVRMRAFQNGHQAETKVRQHARNEARAVLTPAQRQALAHPITLPSR